VNSSIYCFQLPPLEWALGRLENDNAQKEYYLTDVIGILRSGGLKVGTYTALDWREVLGANNSDELVQLESVMALRERGSTK
jgi:bifunctional UDP-N-acetylglucosamine pyrophosphorylase/glucosamine-1-phosphate N-acetyltransferase